MGRLWRKLGCLAAESSAPVEKLGCIKVTSCCISEQIHKLLKLGCLAAESSAPVAKMTLHEGNILLYFRTDPQIVKIVTVSIFCAATRSDDKSHKY